MIGHGAWLKTTTNDAPIVYFMIFQLFIDILNQIGFTTESIELLYFT
jgi:hypothetical protein